MRLSWRGWPYGPFWSTTAKRGAFMAQALAVQDSDRSVLRTGYGGAIFPTSRRERNRYERGIGWNTEPNNRYGPSPITGAGLWTLSFPAGGVTLPGTTTGAFNGPLTGNVTGTATALASTPTKCSAGNYPLGVDASGNAQNCTAAPPGVTTNQNIRSIQFSFDGGGSALSGTMTRCTQVNFAGTIQQVTLLGDVSGSVTVDVQTVAYASYTGPTSASSIAAARSRRSPAPRNTRMRR